MPFKKQRSVGSAPSATDEESRSNALGAIIAELDILKPLPALIDDDSPQFTLMDAVVLGKDGNAPVNLLHAALRGPFRVRGTLVLDRQQKAEYMLPNKKLPRNAIIEIDDVSTFSSEPAPANIWAAGKAGWYEIKPAKEYEYIYDHMAEGVELFYSLEDMHTDEQETARRCPLTVDLLASEVRDPIPSKFRPAYACYTEGDSHFLQWIANRGMKLPVHAIKSTWLEHAKFLIGQMQKSTGDVLWSATPIFAWFAKSAPAIYKQYYPTGYVKTYPSPSMSKARAIVDLIHETMEAHPGRHWTMDTLCKAIPYEKFGLKSADQAKEHIDVNAAYIIKHLDDKYLGGEVSYHLLEKAIERELELGELPEAKTTEDIGPGVHLRAKAENLRRNRETAKTVVDLMHNLAASGLISISSLSIETVADELYARYTVRSESSAIEIIKSASSEITAAIAQWGLRYIHTSICKELCWVSQHRIDNEKLEDEARNLELHYLSDVRDAENVELVAHLSDGQERKAKTISLLVTELLDNQDSIFSSMTVEDIAREMAKHLDVNDEDFAAMVITTNAEPIYEAMDLKYAQTPLRSELIKASAKEVLVMDKSAPEIHLQPRLAMRKPFKRTDSIVSEHITRSKDSAPSSAHPTPRRKSSIKDVEMMDLHTPVQRHPAGKGAGKASTRRPVGTPLIPLRRPSDNEDGSTGSGSPKRRKIEEGRPSVSFASRAEETTPEPDIPYESDDSDSTGAEYENILEPVDLGQTEEPNGPDGLWTCEREGCETVIVQADQEEGRDKVRKHFLWHADEVEARYNLVKAAERPYLPVENLLRHFEKVGQKLRGKEEKEGQKDGDGNKLPKPIKRLGL